MTRRSILNSLDQIERALRGYLAIRLPKALRDDANLIVMQAMENAIDAQAVIQCALSTIDIYVDQRDAGYGPIPPRIVAALADAVRYVRAKETTPR